MIGLLLGLSNPLTEKHLASNENEGVSNTSVLEIQMLAKFSFFRSFSLLPCHWFANVFDKKKKKKIPLSGPVNCFSLCLEYSSSV